MSGDVIAIISGTVVLIALFLILTRSSNRGTNAAADVVNSLGTQYTNIVTVLMGKGK